MNSNKYMKLLVVLSTLNAQVAYAGNCLTTKFILEAVADKSKYVFDNSDYVFIGKVELKRSIVEEYPTGKKSISEAEYFFTVLSVLKERGNKPLGNSAKVFFSRVSCTCAIDFDFDADYKIYASDSKEKEGYISVYYCDSLEKLDQTEY